MIISEQRQACISMAKIITTRKMYILASGFNMRACFLKQPKQKLSKRAGRCHRIFQ